MHADNWCERCNAPIVTMDPMLRRCHARHGYQVHVHEGNRWSLLLDTEADAETWAAKHSYGSAYTIHQR